MAPPPILFLLPPDPHEAGESVPAEGGARAVLGLSLIQRAVLAARRAGYRETILLSGEGAVPMDRWGDLAATLRSGENGALVFAPATILAETDRLTRLAETQSEPSAWATAPGRAIVVPAASATMALSALDDPGAIRDLNAVASRLTSRAGPPALLPAEAAPMIVETAADVPLAERRLMRALVKDTDGFMARHVERPISLAISRLLAPTAITPNQMSLISIVVGICGGPFFLSQRASLQTIGALLFLAHSILDGCDGELARLKFEESRWGGVLDFWGDNVVHVVIFACMGVGWSRGAAAGWPLLLGAAAVLGTLGSAGLVYWRLMRPKDGGGSLFTSVSAEPERPLARVLDAASRRDFIYLVLLLALAGRSHWFLLLAGLGAPIYFCLVLVVAARERSGAAARA
jgi:1L-myo-inositol 1-phosphate cytidylyltransferase / CDP-L-myo-inositol myo-inositolphosphotransferase